MNPYRTPPPCTCAFAWQAYPLPANCAPCTHIERFEQTRACDAHPRRLAMPPPPAEWRD